MLLRLQGGFSSILSRPSFGVRYGFPALSFNGSTPRYRLTPVPRGA
jgi:hypothetical protein